MGEIRIIDLNGMNLVEFVKGKNKIIPKWGKERTGQRSAMGGHFQDKISLDNLTYLYKRDEIGANIIDMPTDDVFAEWFEIKTDSEKLKKEIEELNIKIKLKDEFREGYRYARLYGYGLVAIGYKDSAKLDEEVKNPTDIEYSNSISPTDVKDIKVDKNPFSKTYGEILKYEITFQVDDSSTDKWVHASRIEHILTKTLNNDPHGISVLMALFDKFQVKKNMDWSLGEALYQNASPLRELELPEDADDTEFDSAEKNFTDISARDTFVSPSGYKIHVHDTGKALNPQPTIDYTMDTIGGSARIPRAILLGTQAGTLTGSETNIKDYFKGITTIQKNFIEPMLMDFYKRQQKRGILSEGDFEIEWNPVWEMTEKEDAEIALLKQRTEYLKAQTVLAYLKCEYDVKIDEEGVITVKGEGVAPQQPFGQAGQVGKTEKDYIPKDEMTKIYEKFNLNTQEIINEFKTHFLLRHLIAQKRVITKLEGSYKSAMKAEKSLKTDDKADLLAELLNLDISDSKLRDLIISSLQNAFSFGGERTNIHLADYMGMVVPEPFELDDVQARTWMETSKLIYEDYKDKFVGFIKRSLMEGIAAGEGLEQLKERIAKIGKKYEGNIDTLVRTEIHNAAEKGRIQGYMNNGLEKVEYINGPNPCEECSALAGTILTVEEAANFTWPHPNCQCGYVPYIEGGFKW